jgi:hypothetical protein
MEKKINKLISLKPEEEYKVKIILMLKFNIDYAYLIFIQDISFFEFYDILFFF